LVAAAANPCRCKPLPLQTLAARCVRVPDTLLPRHPPPPTPLPFPRRAQEEEKNKPKEEASKDDDEDEDEYDEDEDDKDKKDATPKEKAAEDKKDEL
jgi:hypothetical protein